MVHEAGFRAPSRKTRAPQRFPLLRRMAITAEKVEGTLELR
jgi:hypothetical protein